MPVKMNETHCKLIDCHTYPTRCFLFGITICREDSEFYINLHFGKFYVAIGRIIDWYKTGVDNEV